MKFKKVGFSLFIFLVLYWIFAIFLITFLLSLSIALIFYLKDGNEFYFDFLKKTAYCLNKAIPGGSILGCGIWIKARLQNKKDIKET